MGGIGIWQILIVLALALLLFGGRGRISSIMGDLAKGITSFRRGLKEAEDEQTPTSDQPRSLNEPGRGETVDVTPERDNADR